MPVHPQSVDIGTIQKRVLRQLKTIAEMRIPVSLTTAVQSLLTAIDSEDSAKMQSSLTTVRESLVDVIIEAIDTRIRITQDAMACCEKSMRLISGVPLVNNRRLDDLGRAIQSLQQSSLQILVDLHEGPVQACLKHNREIPNLEQLRHEIKRWTDFEETIVKPWPCSNRTRKPVNREMLAESKLEYERGESLTIDELIAQLKGKSLT